MLNMTNDTFGISPLQGLIRFVPLTVGFAPDAIRFIAFSDWNSIINEFMRGAEVISRRVFVWANLAQAKASLLLLGQGLLLLGQGLLL
jgi:hypothetical protein